MKDSKKEAPLRVLPFYASGYNRQRLAQLHNVEAGDLIVAVGGVGDVNVGVVAVDGAGGDVTVGVNHIHGHVLGISQSGVGRVSLLQSDHVLKSSPFAVV